MAMKNLNKCKDAVSVLESECEILMHELAPHDWAVFSQHVEELKNYLNVLINDYSNE